MEEATPDRWPRRKARRPRITAGLCADAVQHGRVPGRNFHVRLTAGADAGRLRVEVPGTRAEGRPTAPTDPGAESESGRGLLLVTALADDVILAGSPGVKVGHADETDVPKGHVRNQEADDGPVPDIGRWGHGGSNWSLGGGVLLIPSDEEAFGANRMNTGPEGSGPTGTTGATAHSEYGDRGTTALRNQALVVVGTYGYVTTPEQDGTTAPGPRRPRTGAGATPESFRPGIPERRWAGGVTGEDDRCDG